VKSYQMNSRRLRDDAVMRLEPKMLCGRFLLYYHYYVRAGAAQARKHIRQKKHQHIRDTRIEAVSAGFRSPIAAKLQTRCISG